MVRRRRRRDVVQRRVFRDHSHPFDKYNDIELYRKFRFTRQVIVEITGEIADLLQLANWRGALNPILQVLLTLRFYATGSFQDVCGELVGVSQSTASKTIARVTRALLQRVHNWISFPSQAAADRQKLKFVHLQGFPNVFGCIDGTHVRIQRPADDEFQYVNRKNYHSINVQVSTVSDCRKKKKKKKKRFKSFHLSSSTSSIFADSL